MRSCNFKPIILIAGALAMTFCLCVSLNAQSGRKPEGPRGQQPSEKPIIKLETREVIIPLRAYDADGKFVDDLAAKDVIVLEENEPRAVTSLRREPANIVLVLDLCNEIGTFKNGAATFYGMVEEDQKRDPHQPVWIKPHDIVARPTPREFADNFVSRLSPNDHIAIIQYSDKVQLIQDWTRDREHALDSLMSKYRIGLKSRYLDALKLAAEKLDERTAGRRIIVLVTDGIDTASRASREQALTCIKRSQATVFVIGWAQALRTEINATLNMMGTQSGPGFDILGSGRKRAAELMVYLKSLDGAEVELRNLAELSGGEMWLPPTHQELAGSPSMLVGEIGAQYSLAFITDRRFTTAGLDDTHSIQVLPARRGLSLRTRRGYYVDESTKTGSQ